MDFKAILWERDNPIPCKIFKHIDIITCCAFCPDVFKLHFNHKFLFIRTNLPFTQEALTKF